MSLSVHAVSDYDIKSAQRAPAANPSMPYFVTIQTELILFLLLPAASTLSEIFVKISRKAVKNFCSRNEIGTPTLEAGRPSSKSGPPVKIRGAALQQHNS